MRLAAALLALFVASSPTPAQSLAPIVAPGQRVRVGLEPQGQSSLVGRILSFHNDSIRVARETDTVALARNSISSVEVWTGTRRHVWQGLGVGLLGGVSLGAIAGAISYSPCHAEELFGCLLAPQNRGDAAVLGAAVGGIFGSVLGPVIGAFVVTDRWAPARIASSARLRVVPRSDGVGAQVSYSF